MRKLLPILFLAVLFISCSDDDNNDPGNGNQNGKDMIDEKIIGKWKVEYSKTIKPAQYDEEKKDVIYPIDASIVEYNGDYDGNSNLPISGMFDNREYQINIKSDNSIFMSLAGNSSNNKTESYIIKEGYLLTGGYWTGINNTGTYIPFKYHKYSISGNTLTIEFIGIKENYQWTPYYIISKYSKITE